MNNDPVMKQAVKDYKQKQAFSSSSSSTSTLLYGALLSALSQLIATVIIGYWDIYTFSLGLLFTSFALAIRVWPFDD